MKGKNTLLAAVFQKMSPDMQKKLANELNDFAKSEAAGFTLESLVSYTGTAEPMTPEEIEDKRTEELSNRMFEHIRNPGMNTIEGRQASNVNVQEM